jgi:hypothetical protein
LKLYWIRGKERNSFTRPKTFFCSGQIGTGKSTLLEHIGLQHHKRGSAILDLFGSADGESLAWLRSPEIKDKRVCLLRGENVDVKTEHDVKTTEQLTLKNLETYDFIISSRPLYLNKDFEFYSIGKLTDLLYRRLSWNRLLYIIAREAGNLWFSRLKVSEGQSDAKAEAIYMLREMRHLGCALGLDTLRTMAIDIDIRAHTDTMLLKSQGIGGLSKDMSWLYGYYEPSFVRNMPNKAFMYVSRRGALGLGVFPYHTWHKEERENILSSVGLKVEYGEVLDMGLDRGDYRTIGDKEHAEIITGYHSGESMNKLADRLGRSTKSISDHIHGHDKEVLKGGFCATCKKLRSELSSSMARGKVT